MVRGNGDGRTPLYSPLTNAVLAVRRLPFRSAPATLQHLRTTFTFPIRVATRTVSTDEVTIADSATNVPRICHVDSSRKARTVEITWIDAIVHGDRWRRTSDHRRRGGGAAAETTAFGCCLLSNWPPVIVIIESCARNPSAVTPTTPVIHDYWSRKWREEQREHRRAARPHP